MAVYYIDFDAGRADCDGLSPDRPLSDERLAPVKPGDTVLFRRGTERRGRLYDRSGEPGAPITWGAWGDGSLPKPVFRSSVDLSDPALWRSEGGKLWSCGALRDESANFVFDGGSSCGTLRWTREELSGPGDFYDNAFGCRERQKPFPKEHRVWLVSDGNPGEVWKSVECVVYGERSLASVGHDLILQDLSFTASGVHGVASGGTGRSMTLNRCDFSYIGGAVWNAERRIRFGNAFELWNAAWDIEVSDCTFTDIYDSAVTHQGGRECLPAERLSFRRNRFEKCGMAAWEQRDRMPIDSVFEDNICLAAGEGSSKNGEVMPRRSEIWPQPMGHHLFFWRIQSPTKGGGVEVKNNRFGDARYGAAVYSIIDRAAEEQMRFSGNRFDGEMLLAGRFHGKDLRTVSELNMVSGC